jgi:predicted O-methyltransferase YrrM
MTGVGQDVESFVAEDDVLVEARASSAAAGCRPVTPGVGSALRFLAAAVSAKAVVEVGTGTGVSGLWLLRGMVPGGTLTSIDVDPERQRAARAAFTADGNGPSRLRLINGMSLEVLPRLTDGGYDLVFVDAAPAEHAACLDESVRLLRVGGVVALHGVLPDAGPGDDASGAALRDVANEVAHEVTQRLRGDEQLTPVLLPLGDGLLAAVKRA